MKSLYKWKNLIKIPKKIKIIGKIVRTGSHNKIVLTPIIWRMRNKKSLWVQDRISNQLKWKNTNIISLDVLLRES